jgi:hypothetical protein
MRDHCGTPIEIMFWRSNEDVVILVEYHPVGQCGIESAD